MRSAASMACRLRPRRARFRGRRGPSHGALQPRRVRSPGRSPPWPAGFCHGAFQLAGGDAPRGVRRCAGLGQQLFRFVAGRCGISRQGEQQGAEEKQDMFHTEMFLELLVVKDVVVIFCGGLTQRLGRGRGEHLFEVRGRHVGLRVRYSVTSRPMTSTAAAAAAVRQYLRTVRGDDAGRRDVRLRMRSCSASRLCGGMR